MSPAGRDPTLSMPFGAASRASLLEQFFTERPLNPTTAWTSIYQLLLWVDRTTGLAHCYESDKAQPGRTWYARSLAFHAYCCGEFGVTPAELGKHIDWLFREATLRLAKVALTQQETRSRLAEAQRQPWATYAMPEPGEDPQLRELLEQVMDADLSRRPSEESIRLVMERIQAHFSAENRRKNLLGEGFEDTLAAVIQRMPKPPATVVPRRPLDEIPGFRTPPAGEKVRKVDLALVEGERRILVSAKWSVRADREEQFGVDFDTYARLEDSRKDWEFVLVTNEFDAARLVSACERRAPGRRLFDHVVHVNPDAVLAVYEGTTRAGAASRLPELVSAGRLESLDQWLADVAT